MLLNIDFVRGLLEEFEDSDINITPLMYKTLRLASFRKDLEQIIFIKLNLIGIYEKSRSDVYEYIQELGLQEGQSKTDINDLLHKESMKTISFRTVRTFDYEKSRFNDGVVILSTNEIITNLEQSQTLLQENKVPETMVGLDLYHITNIKNRKDTIYAETISNYTLVLRNIKNYLYEYIMEVENLMKEQLKKDDITPNDELKLLIIEGENVKARMDAESNKRIYYSGQEYVSWLTRITKFVRKHVTDRNLVKEIESFASKANGNGKNHFNEIIGRLNALEDSDFNSVTQQSVDDKLVIDKIFISHAAKDVDYVAEIVQLLNDIGIVKDAEKIFCSSLPGYDIPYGANIYEFLKEELNKSNIMVLFILSDNYYESTPCLNEMGATWITSKEYGSVLLPNFDFKKVRGAIDPLKISFNIDNQNGLDKFREKILEIFNLTETKYTIWTSDRDRFIERINQIKLSVPATREVSVLVEKVKKVENMVQIQYRIVNNTNTVKEFTYLDFILTDSHDNTIKFDSSSNQIEKLILHAQENRVEFIDFIAKEDNSYNPMRNNKEMARVEFGVQ